jgi:hypothetical protein
MAGPKKAQGGANLSNYWYTRANTMMKKLIVCLLICLTSGLAHAQSTDDLSQDDTYDPFADYSEFEASADEEADINFFKNGRFFNLAFLFGGQMFTEEMGQLIKPAPEFGMYFTYFFDIRTAIQISYLHSDHAFNVESGSTPAGAYNGFSGNVSLSNVEVYMKYYFNTQNITRGFADLNPYLVGGLSINYRTISLTGETVLLKSSPTGVDFGAGIEIPIARNKMYLGLQMMYHYVSFPDENSQLFDGDNNPTGRYLKGDFIDGLFVLGINF